MIPLRGIDNDYETYNDIAVVLQTKLDEVKAQCTAERQVILRAIPPQYSLGSVDELIDALMEVASPEMQARYAKMFAPDDDTADAGKKPAAKRKSPTPVPPETRNQIAAALQAGNSTADVATHFGPSSDSVHKIKKSMGLTAAAEPRAAG